MSLAHDELLDESQITAKYLPLEFKVNWIFGPLRDLCVCPSLGPLDHKIASPSLLVHPSFSLSSATSALDASGTYDLSAGCYRKNDRNLITFDGRMRLVTAKMIRSALHTSSNGSKNRPPSIAQCFAHQPAKYTFYVSASSLFQHIFTTNTKFYFRFVSVHLRFHICVKFSWEFSKWIHSLALTAFLLWNRGWAGVVWVVMCVLTYFSRCKRIGRIRSWIQNSFDRKLHKPQNDTGALTPTTSVTQHFYI